MNTQITTKQNNPQNTQTEIKNLQPPLNQRVMRTRKKTLPLKKNKQAQDIQSTRSWLNKYFIYRHESLNKYLLINEFHDTLDKLCMNYYRQLEQYRKISKQPPINNPNNLPIIETSISTTPEAISPVQKTITQKIPEKNKKIMKSQKKKFICVGGYPDITKSLLKKGWIKINNLKSQEFEFIWTLKTNDINFPLLKNHQLANHYFKNGQITRKSGLCKNIKNIYFKGIDPNNFFPRCYDLSNKIELEDFIQDYKFTWAMSLLKLFIKDYHQIEINQNNSSEFSRFTVSTLETAINIIERNLFLFENSSNYVHNNNILNSLKNDKKYLISNEEWDKIYLPELTKQSNIQDLITEVNNNKPGSINNPLINNKGQKIYSKNFLNNTNAKLVLFNNSTGIRSDDTGVYNPTLNNAAVLKNKIKKMNEESNNKNEKNKILPLAKYTDYKAKIEEILKILEKSCPQYKLNGYRNIWIMKPSNLSRGRGVTVVDSLTPIEQSMSAINNSGIILQKYIENPLIIYNRKFDIRQWVLVTSLSPLIIWLWKEPYLRFGAEDYVMDDLNNIYSHLTNNSIAKHSSQFLYENKFEGDMWTCQQFDQYLGNGKWQNIHEKIKNAVICSFFAAHIEIKHRLKSFELFGYDFMVDEDLNVFLIEVNASPAMDYSTKITEKLVKEMAKDLIKITVDCNNGKSCSEIDLENIKFMQIFNESKDKITIPKNIPNKELLH